MGIIPLPSGDRVCFVNPVIQRNRADAKQMCIDKGFDGLIEGRTNEDRMTIARIEMCKFVQLFVHLPILKYICPLGLNKQGQSWPAITWVPPGHEMVPTSSWVQGHYWVGGKALVQLSRDLSTDLSTLVQTCPHFRHYDTQCVHWNNASCLGVRWHTLAPTWL